MISISDGSVNDLKKKAEEDAMKSNWILRKQRYSRDLWISGKYRNMNDK